MFANHISVCTASGRQTFILNAHVSPFVRQVPSLLKVMASGYMETVAEKVTSAHSRAHTGTHFTSQAGYCCVLLARLFPSSAFALADPSVASDALRCPFITVQKVAHVIMN
jgi:hypothetical protein